MIRGQRNGQMDGVLSVITLLGFSVIAIIGWAVYEDFSKKIDTEKRVELKLDQIAVSDLRLVTVQYKDDSCEYIIHKDKVDRFIEVQKELYYNPGINPYNSKKTTQLIAICVSEPCLGGPYWWSTPGLEVIPKHESGVQILNWYDFEIVWTAPSQ